MKIVVKKEGEVIFSSDDESYINIELDEYDIVRTKTHSGSKLFNDINELSIVRIQTAH